MNVHVIRLRHGLVVVLTAFLILAGAPSFGAPDDEPIWQSPPAPADLPDITIETMDGESHHLSDYRGKIVLLSFWATWCGPCILELPSLAKTRAALGADAITVLAVSEDRGGRSDVEKFAGSHPEIAAMLSYLDPHRRGAKALGITVVPTTILVDRQGRELGRLTGGADWSSPEWRNRIAEALAVP